MRKHTTGQTIRFVWTPNRPYTGTPSLTIGFSPVFSSDLAQIRPDVSVTAVGSDRRTLTLGSSVSTQLEADEVSAFLKTTRDTWCSVKVVRLGGTTAILAEPLPRELDLTSVATLNFGASFVSIDSSHATKGLYNYFITWADELTSVHTESGVLKVCARPFDTGLDHNQLVNQFPQLADMVPRRQSNHDPQIEAAKRELILSIRDHVISDGATEDDVFNQQSFVTAHAYCAAAIVYESALRLDVAEAMRERYQSLLEVALRSVTLDLDGDGIIDEGETDLRRSGGSSTDFRGSFRGYTKTENDSDFTPSRGMRH